MFQHLMRLLASLTLVGLMFEVETFAAPFQAGTAKVDITPSPDSAVDILGKPLQLRDSLFARVLVLKDEKVSIAIVSVDSLVFASPKVVAEGNRSRAR